MRRTPSSAPAHAPPSLSSLPRPRAGSKRIARERSPVPIRARVKPMSNVGALGRARRARHGSSRTFDFERNIQDLKRRVSETTMFFDMKTHLQRRSRRVAMTCRHDRLRPRGPGRAPRRRRGGRRAAGGRARRQGQAHARAAAPRSGPKRTLVAASPRMPTNSPRRSPALGSLPRGMAYRATKSNGTRPASPPPAAPPPPASLHTCSCEQVRLVERQAP